MADLIVQNISSRATFTSTREPLPYAMIVIIALLLLVGYVGSYFALMETQTVQTMDAAGRPTSIVEPAYGLSPETAKTRGALRKIYSPLHAIDRQLRPSYWTHTATDRLKPEKVEAEGLFPKLAHEN